MEFPGGVVDATHSGVAVTVSVIATCKVPPFEFIDNVADWGPGAKPFVFTVTLMFWDMAGWMVPLLVSNVTHAAPPVAAFQVNGFPPLFRTTSDMLCDVPACIEPKFKEVVLKFICGGCDVGAGVAVEGCVGDGCVLVDACDGSGAIEEFTCTVTCTLCFPPLEVIVIIAL